MGKESAKRYQDHWYCVSNLPFTPHFSLLPPRLRRGYNQYTLGNVVVDIRWRRVSC